MEIIEGSRARSTWANKKKNWKKLGTQWRAVALSRTAIEISAKIIKKAMDVSGKNAAKSETLKLISAVAVRRFGPLNGDVDKIAIHLIRRGVARCPDFEGVVKLYTPMPPSMLAVWLSVIRPTGIRHGILPRAPSVDFCYTQCFRIAAIFCSRGLRGADPLLAREKGFTKQEARGSPKFEDLEVGNTVLQTVVQPPFKILRNSYGALSTKNWVQNWKILLKHPATNITVTLRWIKNAKEAHFSSEVSFTRVKFGDVCAVTNIILLILHRTEHYRELNWDYVLAVPKVVQQGFQHPVDGWIEEGEVGFVPFTKPRFDESWTKLQKIHLGEQLYSVHDIRRGLQKALRRAGTTGVMQITIETRREFGRWKRPSDGEMAGLYAGQDVYLMDKIYKTILTWDVEALAGQLPCQMGRDLMNNLNWVRKFPRGLRIHIRNT
jgi:hypothetical protein